MALLRKNNWWYAILYSRFTLVTLGLLIILLAFAVYGRYVIEREVADRRADQEAELKTLEGRQKELQEKVRYLDDEQGVEAEIRRHFDVAIEGEDVVILVENQNNASNTGNPISWKDKKERSWWNFWRVLIPW